MLASHVSASRKRSSVDRPKLYMERAAHEVVCTASKFRVELDGEKLPLVDEPSAMSW